LPDEKRSKMIDAVIVNDEDEDFPPPFVSVALFVACFIYEVE
jgi:hypothetical protein